MTDVPEFLDHLVKMIDRSVDELGRAVIGTRMEETDTVYSYTVGNLLAGYPELVLVGVNPLKAVHLLNYLSGKMGDDRQALVHGQVFQLPGAERPMKFVTCPDEAVEKHLRLAKTYLSHRGVPHFEALQVLLSDPAGKFPGQVGCEPHFARQRLEFGK